MAEIGRMESEDSAVSAHAMLSDEPLGLCEHVGPSEHWASVWICAQQGSVRRVR